LVQPQKATKILRCPQARLEPSTSQYVFGASDLNKITMKETEKCRKMEEDKSKGD